jgi:MYXO-CTERM domain-containing protein
MKTPSPTLLVLVVLAAASTVRADPPVETATDILCRGYSALGFSYSWGGECWCADGCEPNLSSCSPGDCTVNPGGTGCPDCSHSGTYGADCSGFVTKAWQVPDPVAVNACDVFRYVAESFTADSPYWDPVSMSSLQPADAAATTSHVVLIAGGRDSSGYWDVVEARGCNYGIVHRYRSLSGFVGARRINIATCVCAAGDSETEDCGDCGSRRRDCSDGCGWSGWSACEGPDPAGADTTCTVEGAVGACTVGRRACVAGWLTCHPQSATTELCDGLDNDCDGVTDNGTPASLGAGYPCTSADGPGVSDCIDGALVCVPSGQPDGGPPPDAADPGDADDPDVIFSDADQDGCGCSVSADPSAVAALPFLALFGLFVRRRRR